MWEEPQAPKSYRTTWNPELGTYSAVTVPHFFLIMKSMSAFRLGILILTGTLFSVMSSASASSLPEIPDLSQPQLEKFRPAVREQIAKAYQRVQAHPEDGESNGQLGMILHAHNLWELATIFYGRAELLEADSFRWAYYLALAQDKLGKNREAMDALQKAIHLKPEDFPARLKLAQLLLAAGEFPESGRMYQALVEEYPGSALAHYGLGQVQSTRGESRAAIESYLRACRLASWFGAAHYALGMAYRDLGEEKKSQQQFSLFERWKDAAPEVEDPLWEAVKALQSRGRFHFYEGLRRQAGGDLQNAVAEYERALEAEPELWEAHSNLLAIYVALGQWDQGAKHYHAAVKIHPNRWETHHNYGILLSAQERFREAVDAFGKALDINPFSADAHNSLAEALAGLGRFEEAIRHARLAIENEPQSRRAHFILGGIELSRGKTAQAIDHFLATLTVEDERTPILMFHLAEAYARSGNRDKALYYLRQAQQRAASLGHAKLLEDIEAVLQRFQGAEDAQ